MNSCSNIWIALTRKKRIDSNEESKLAKVLNLFDLTALGVGSTLGLGVYVLAGSVAYGQAGPAVVISFLLAAIASAFAGLLNFKAETNHLTDVEKVFRSLLCRIRCTRSGESWISLCLLVCDCRRIYSFHNRMEFDLRICDWCIVSGAWPK